VTHHIRWQLILIFTGLVLVGILLAYLATNYTTVLRPGSGGTYVEALVGSPVYLNPLLSGYNEADRDVCYLLFRGLTRLNTYGEIEADLATGWDVTLDGLTYTFHLRPNAYWHDGTPVTADDVLFTIGLLRDVGFNGPPELGMAVWRTVTVEKVDRRTVRFVLSEPFAPFLDYTTVGLLPAHLLEGVSGASLPASQFNMSPVGNGPFQLTEVKIENGMVTSLLLEQFPRYYGKRPHLDRIQFQFYPNAELALEAYQKGEVEGLSQVTRSQWAHVRDLPTLNLYSAPLAEYSLVFLNLKRSDLPFQETEVRQALLYALDRQRLVDQVLGGQGIVIHSPLLPGTWAYEENLPRYSYDPDTAQELLDTAGWYRSHDAGGVRYKGSRPLEFTLLTSNDPEQLAIAQMMAEQWSRVGITVSVTTASSLEVRDALERRQFEAVLSTIAVPGDPDLYPFWHETQVDQGQNYAGFVHRRGSEVLEQARIEVNRERRRELYREFQRIFAQEVPALLLYAPVYTYGVDERIHDVQIGPLMYPADRFRTVADWWIVPRRVFVSESELHP